MARILVLLEFSYKSATKLAVANHKISCSDNRKPLKLMLCNIKNNFVIQQTQCFEITFINLNVYITI